MPTRQGASRTIRGGSSTDPLFVQEVAGSVSASVTISDPNTPATKAEVLTTDPGASAAGIVVREANPTGLTDAQLRAQAVPVSAGSLPLPAGASTAAKQLPDNHNVTVSNQPAFQFQDGILLSGRPDVLTQGTVSGLGAVTLNAASFGSLSSFSFEATGFTTGTFVIERTLAADPTSGSALWTIVGAFKAGTRRAAGVWVNEPGAFHGNMSASTGLRIRFTVAPNTTASVRILASEGTGTITIGAIANNPDNIIGAVADLGQYYASNFGGRVIFNASTGDSTGLTGTAVNNLAWLRNPIGSGVDLVIYRISLGASAVVKFRRYRNGNPAVVGTPTTPTRFNRGGGSNTSQGILYKQAQFSYTPLEANLGKVSYIPANGNDTDPVNGSIILRPGESTIWTVAGVSGLGGGYEASVEVVWWELAAAA